MAKCRPARRAARSSAAIKFHDPMSRPLVQTPYPLVADGNGNAGGRGRGTRICLSSRPRSSRGTTSSAPIRANSRYVNPVTGKGPVEGRPPGEFFAHQRWTATGPDSDLFPKVGYLMSIGQCEAGTASIAEHSGTERQCHLVVRDAAARPCRPPRRVAPRLWRPMPVQAPLRRAGGDAHLQRPAGRPDAERRLRPQRDLDAFPQRPSRRRERRRQQRLPFPRHLLRLPLEPDPGAARPQERARDHRSALLDKASGPTDSGGLQRVEGDFRELQGSLWMHDHRFFFTAENVHKGMFALANIYSGPDRGCETLNDGINLRLPSGWLNNKSWGNTDFDVNLAVSNPATAQDGQLFFDIFDTDGFLGDMLASTAATTRISRCCRGAIASASSTPRCRASSSWRWSSTGAPIARGTKVPFHFIANDGNLVVNPIKLSELDEQGVGERYDIVVDFRTFKPGDSIYLTNLLKQTGGRRPDGAVTVGQALAGDADDPCVGPILEFRVVSQVQSVDAPGTSTTCRRPIKAPTSPTSGWTSGVKTLTRQIPVVAPVRTREFEYGRSGGGDSRGPDGQCIPDCPEGMPFPWSIKVNGQGGPHRSMPTASRR